MTDERIDFSGLDPTADAERFDDIVDSIGEAAAPALAARRARAGVFGQVSGWWRPLLAAAAIAGIVSAATLAGVQTPAVESEEELGLAEAIGVPQQIAQWVRSDEVPEPAELLLALEDGR
jgi:negative regulator of sigma E activity